MTHSPMLHYKGTQCDAAV